MHPRSHGSLPAAGAHIAPRTVLPSLCASRNTHRSPPYGTGIVRLLPHILIAARRFTHISPRSRRKAHRSALFYKQIAAPDDARRARQSCISEGPCAALPAHFPTRCQNHIAPRLQSTLALRPDTESSAPPTHTSPCCLRHMAPPEPSKHTDPSAPADKYCSELLAHRFCPPDGGLIPIPDERTRHSAASLCTHCSAPPDTRITPQRLTHTSVSARLVTDVSSPGDTRIALRSKQQTLRFALPRHTRVPRSRRRARTSPHSAPAASPPSCAARITLHFDSQETGISMYMDLGRRHLSTAHENSQCSATPSP